MLKLVKMECPSCGATLKRRGLGQLRCPYCNANYIIDMDLVVPAPQEPSQKKEPVFTPDTIRAMVMISGLFFVMLILTIFFYALGSYNTSKNKTQTAIQTASQNPTQSTKTQNAAGVTVTAISSDYFRYLVTQAFGKDYTEVTPKELVEITYLDTNDYGKIHYKLNDGDLQTIYYEDRLSRNYLDLQFFPGLKELYTHMDEHDQIDIHSLTQLEVFSSYLAPEKLLALLPNPEKLLSLDCDFEKGEIGDIGILENLQTLILRIDDDMTPDLSNLSALRNLTSFTLYNDGYNVLSFLEDMPQMKSIKLDCDSLKDIHFVENMPDLEEFGLKDGDIISLDPFLQTPKLKILKLLYCNDVKSLKPIAELESLEEIHIRYTYGQEMPESFAKLQKVKKLTLEGFHDIGFLGDFKNVTYLDMYGCDYSHIDGVKEMKNLEYLKLKTGYNLNSLACINGLEHLSVIDFSGFNSYAYLEGIFNLPNIKEINLNDSELAMDFSLIHTNPSLEILRLNNLKWRCNGTVLSDGSIISADYANMDGADFIGFVNSFPNLRELYAQGNKLDNLDFIRYLQKLEILDITNNYIRDLSPLNDLVHFNKVYCGENTLTPNQDLREDITMDDQSPALTTSPFSERPW